MSAIAGHDVSLLIMLCYFGDAFVMQSINMLKASLVYGKRLTICVQCTLLVLVSVEIVVGQDQW